MDPFDANIRNSMRSWSARQPLPANGRARLMAAAVQHSPRPEQNSRFYKPALTDDLFSWVLLYSMERGVCALRTVS